VVRLDLKSFRVAIATTSASFFAWPYQGSRHCSTDALPSYRISFGICFGFLLAAVLMLCVNWFLTRNTEFDARRIKLLKIEAAKRGEVYGEDDVKVFEERKFYETGKLHKKHSLVLE
jgi:hypothetical protein